MSSEPSARPLHKRQGDKPLHLQAEQWVRELIARPEYRDGKLLPDEVSLAKELDISRNTLRAALQRLVAEGMLYRVPGVGTRVAHRQISSKVTAWTSFSNEMKRLGINVEDSEWTLERLPAPATVAQRMGIKDGTPSCCLRRIRGWDNIPAVFAVSWLHPSIMIDGTLPSGTPMYQVIAATSGMRPASSFEEVNAITASTEVAQALQVKKGSAVLLRRRIVKDSSGSIMEYCETFSRPDRYTLVYEEQVPV